VRELGGEPERTPPVFFLKPADSLVPGGGDIHYPPKTKNLHYEIELVVAIGEGGRNLAAGAVRDHVYGYAVGIDLTRRDHQQAAKDSGGPWDTAKSFEQAAPISPLSRASDIGHPDAGRIWLAVNGDVRQDADLGDMIWTIDEAVAELSSLFTLRAGDLLFTGTPAGVGAVAAGDRLTGGVDGVGSIDIRIID
ncbi:MAG: fumarylacetoacetate hydrolase family protein, partial [Woeseiaceae bacterium]|nr:fumarylacetoacetate hydrolase family protein [Woeseiaceae bacterium]